MICLTITRGACRSAEM